MNGKRVKYLRREFEAVVNDLVIKRKAASSNGAMRKLRAQVTRGDQGQRPKFAQPNGKRRHSGSNPTHGRINPMAMLRIPR